jgi:hypothetical protein
MEIGRIGGILALHQRQDHGILVSQENEVGIAPTHFPHAEIGGEEVRRSFGVIDRQVEMIEWHAGPLPALSCDRPADMTRQQASIRQCEPLFLA